ncbi:hypothetical protein Tco_0878300 [Tanacetum coccineum]|uniref:Uncharacterized protein n=1 Tax=Tanacetum coccineum TaxID=301880 RepID=A0ABQ5BZC8_9ASTR
MSITPFDSTYFRGRNKTLAAEEDKVRVLIYAASSSEGSSSYPYSSQSAADIPKSPDDYIPTDASQTSGGDEGLLDLYALNRRENLKKRRRKQRKRQRKKNVYIPNWGGNKAEDVSRSFNVQFHQTQEEEPIEQFKDDGLLADILLNRPKGLSIPGPMQSQPQQPSQASDPKEKGKGILIEETQKTYERVSRIHRKILSKFNSNWFPEKENQNGYRERDAKRLLKEEKATVTEETAIQRSLNEDREQFDVSQKLSKDYRL